MLTGHMNRSPGARKRRKIASPGCGRVPLPYRYLCPVSSDNLGQEKEQSERPDITGQSWSPIESKSSLSYMRP